MANIIRVTPVENMPGYYEFDYKIPQTKQRIRRKIKSTYYQSQLLQRLLADILVNEYDKENTFTCIHTEPSYMEYSTYLEEAINSLYYSYCDKLPLNVNERETAKHDLFMSMFPLKKYEGKFCLLGRIGVGKSTIIKKTSCFWGNSNISFPFTDTSRTSSFPADYCFIPDGNGYKFLVLFKPTAIIDMHINECIERATYKLIELTTTPQNDCAQIDAIFDSFIQDPSQSFDIRFSLGKYIKTTSPAIDKPENRDTVYFWNNLFFQFKDLIGYINKAQTELTEKTTYYQLLYSDAIKAQNTKEPIYQTYLYILDLINERRRTLYNKLLKELEQNPAIKPGSIHSDLDEDLVPYFYCELTNMESKGFYDFIKAFTAKKSSEFGHSFFNLVDHLRIELPLNPNIRLPRKGFTFVFQDTIGISHTNDNTGGFENSTRLNIEDADSVIIVDDSRINGDSNASVIIQHLAARLDPSKINFAFTFYDDLIKEDFEEDDDINEQRTSYLISTEANTVKNAVQDAVIASRIINRLNSNHTFFLENLMLSNSYESIEDMLNKLISPLLTSKNEHGLYKLDFSKPFVIYDYKKLPLLYSKALEEFCHIQDNIYNVSPPHYKTTEALTNRLSLSQSYFTGARNLHPVDDLYNSIIIVLAPFIEFPAKINFDARDTYFKPILIGELKTLVTKAIRESINKRFFNQTALAEWKRLYLLTGTGSDKLRRNGLISMENTIAPNIESYLNSVIKEHIIDTIETAFVDSIASLEMKYEMR